MEIRRWKQNHLFFVIHDSSLFYPMIPDSFTFCSSTFMFHCFSSPLPPPNGNILTSISLQPSTGISEIQTRHYLTVSCILNHLNSNVVTFLSISWAKSNFCLKKLRINKSSFSCSTFVLYNSEAQTTTSAVRNWNVNTRVHLVGLTN